MATSQNNKKKVFVGLSGGVDSSVSAALLKEQGYDVTGVFIKTWHPDFLPCTWKEDRLDAMRVAAHLDIPFLTFDFEKEYKEDVADYMIAEYRKGRTPNPDVMCNKYVKFGAFLDQAREMGADFVATGHYAQKKAAETLTGRGEEEDGEKTYELFAGADKEKDQTYFLWTLPQKKLQSVLFPVGAFQKSHVRELARKFALPTAERKDSQGVCFLGALNMREFLENFIPSKKGDVLDESGRVIGEHEGALFYTFGQRHGFTVTQQSDERKPLYVVGKNLEQNTLTVSESKISEKRNFREARLSNVNWISDIPEEGKTILARFRYRQPLQKVQIRIENGAGGETMRVFFEEPQESWAPGQSLVVYDPTGEKCPGGGVLEFES
ncbi:MAG TPA: tRNA 2-thiouridine(34) synthase MnmA [Candidatus Paceibacterota bacterium]|nr:tRNA 2-thiouridine(34) synthase MnmA [Candidatus Paceibacterota bacterium]